MRQTRQRPLLAVGAALLVVGALVGCAPAVQTPIEAPVEAPTSSDPAESAGTQGVDASLQPVPGASAVDAAQQLIAIHLDLLREGRFEEACSLYRPAFAEQLIQLSGSSAACAEALHQGFVTSVEEAQQVAESLGEAPLTPAFYLPSAILVDASQLSADQEWLAYVTGTAIRSDDTTQFRDGTGQTPVWLARSFYVQQGDDGVWRFAAATDRDDRSTP